MVRVNRYTNEPSRSLIRTLCGSYLWVNVLRLLMKYHQSVVGSVTTLLRSDSRSTWRWVLSVALFCVSETWVVLRVYEGHGSRQKIGERGWISNFTKEIPWLEPVKGYRLRSNFSERKTTRRRNKWSKYVSFVCWNEN